MLLLITYIHNFNEQCVVLVIFSLLCFFSDYIVEM